MIDLAAKVHYKARFDIERIDSSKLLFDSFFENVMNWMKVKFKASIYYWNWDQITKFGNFQNTNNNVFLNVTSHYISPDHRYWAMKLDEQQTFESTGADIIETSPRIWSTEIGFEQESSEIATISLINYYVDRAGFVGLQAEPPRHSTPQIFYRFLTSANFKCIANQTLVSNSAKSLGNGYGEKLGREICSNTRGIPYILIIPPLTTFDEEAASWAKDLAIKITPHVIANANVFYAESSTFSEELSYFVPRDLQCYPGNLCIYWPAYKDSKGQEVLRRRFFTREQIHGLGQETLIGIIRRVLSNDINYYESREMFRRQDCDALYRKQKMQELREKYVSSVKSVTAASESSSLLEQLFNYSEQENADYRDKNEKLNEELKDLSTEINGLRSYNVSLVQQNESLREQTKSLETLRNLNKMPQTVFDVLVYFEKVYPDRIAFTERAKRSLNTCVTKPEIVWDCLFSMSNTLVDLYRMPSCPNLVTVFKERTNWVLARGEGAASRKSRSLMQLRRDTYMGKEINIEPHVKKGNKDTPDSIRVYFTYDAESEKIIIGHIGIHIENYSTSKL